MLSTFFNADEHKYTIHVAILKKKYLLSGRIGVFRHLLQNHLHGRVCQDLLHLWVGHGLPLDGLRVVTLLHQRLPVAVQSFLVVKCVKRGTWLSQNYTFS